MKLLTTAVLAGILILGATASASAKDEFSKDTMKRMGVFVSNFTECFFNRTTREEMTANNENLVNFAMCHLKVNAWKSSYIPLPECLNSQKGMCAYGEFKVPSDKVARVIKKYLDYDMKKFASTEYYHYEKGFFYAHGADGEQPEYAVVRKARTLDNGNIEVQASLYNPEAEDGPASDDIELIAVIKPYVFESKKTWSLVSIKRLDDDNEADEDEDEDDDDYEAFNPQRNPKFEGFWEDDVVGKTSMEISSSGDGAYTIITSHAMGAFENVECTYRARLEDDRFLKPGQAEKCLSTETSDDGSPDKITAADKDSIEVILMDGKGRLQVPYECDSDDVTSCSTPYRRVKR